MNTMSTEIINLSEKIFVPNNVKYQKKYPRKSFTSIAQKNSEINKKLTHISKRIRPESALFTMIKLLVEHRNEINIVDSVLSINSNDLDLVQKLNYCMEFLAHIPFSFQYDKLQTEILLDFFHLEDEMKLIDNLEL